MISARNTTSKERKHYQEAYKKLETSNRCRRGEKGRRHWPVRDAGSVGLERCGNWEVLPSPKEASDYAVGHGHYSLPEGLRARLPDEGKRSPAARDDELFWTRAATAQPTDPPRRYCRRPRGISRLAEAEESIDHTGQTCYDPVIAHQQCSCLQVKYGKSPLSTSLRTVPDDCRC